MIFIKKKTHVKKNTKYISNIVQDRTRQVFSLPFSVCKNGSIGWNCESHCVSGFYGYLCTTACECEAQQCDKQTGCQSSSHNETCEWSISSSNVMYRFFYCEREWRLKNRFRPIYLSIFWHIYVKKAHNYYKWFSYVKAPVKTLNTISTAFTKNVFTESTDKGDIHERSESAVRKKPIQSNEKQPWILVSFLLIGSLTTSIVGGTAFYFRKGYRTFLFTIIYNLMIAYLLKVECI